MTWINDRNPAFSNELSDAEAERLALLAEELGEAVQAIGKVLRHGYDSYHPDFPQGDNNRERLEKELGDVQAAITLMVIAGDLKSSRMESAISSKLDRVHQYLHCQP